MKLLTPHVAEAQMHDLRRRRAHENAIREISILGDNHQMSRFGEKPQFAVRELIAKIQRVNHRQCESETLMTRPVTPSFPTMSPFTAISATLHYRRETARPLSNCTI